MPDICYDGKDPVTGHFVAGNKRAAGVGGNPQTKRMKELRQAVVDATTEEEVRDVMQAMHAAAKDGDVAAARCWLEYVLGKPAQAVTLEGDTGGKLLIELIHKAARNGHDDTD